jgi:hypothetical protein
MEWTPHSEHGSADSNMISEAHRIVDEARNRGIVLRTLGGLAVRAHCKVIRFCERDYADFDMAGLSRQHAAIVRLMDQLGYRENPHVSFASGGRQLQFTRECEPRDAAPQLVHSDPHVDVFLDTLSMDHDIPLKERLTLDDYTVSVTDVLLTKLQIYSLNEKDVRDILTLLKDLEIGDDDRPGVINAAYVARCCARDWGLCHDVIVSLALCLERARDYDLSSTDLERIGQGELQLVAAIETAPKTLSWRLRAIIGTHQP